MGVMMAPVEGSGSMPACITLVPNFIVVVLIKEPQRYGFYVAVEKGLLSGF
jgi:hypothetical protein